jgi:hypothetical protein
VYVELTAHMHLGELRENDRATLPAKHAYSKSSYSGVIHIVPTRALSFATATELKRRRSHDETLVEI